MATLDELLRAIDASIKSTDYTLGVSEKVIPHGTRVNVVRSQLELAREILVKARGYAAAKSSGTFDATELKKALPVRTPEEAQIKEADQKLAERLQTPDGQAAMKEAAERSRKRAEEIERATRADPAALRRRYTPTR